MKIQVRKPTEQEIKSMKMNPTWGCGVSKFDWHYDEEEHALIIKGAVTVTYDGGSATFEAGDYCIFPKGMSCVWDVTEAVEKYYEFR